MKRSAPEQGYDFSAKEVYRRSLWRRLASELDVTRVNALIMPSIEGQELEMALRVGVHPSRLHVVDKNPAIVAHLKRRYPGVETYGVLASKACRRIQQKAIRLSVANFDFTQPASLALLRELYTVARSGCWAERGLIAITLLRGREKSTDVIKRFSEYAFNALDGCTNHVAGVQEAHARMAALDWGRLMWISVIFWHALVQTIPIKVGLYRSTAGNQTMLWCLFRFWFDPNFTKGESPLRGMSTKTRSHDEWRTQWGFWTSQAHKEFVSAEKSET